MRAQRQTWRPFAARMSSERAVTSRVSASSTAELRPLGNMFGPLPASRIRLMFTGAIDWFVLGGSPRGLRVFPLPLWMHVIDGNQSLMLTWRPQIPQS
jgi:hypothetical protein